MHIVSSVQSTHFLVMSWLYCLKIYIIVTLFKTGTSWVQASKSDITSSGTSNKSGISYQISSFITSNSGGTSTWSGCWGGVTGIDCGGQVEVASLWISWMQRYSLLSGTGSSSHSGSSWSGDGRVSLASSESVSSIGGSISSKVRHWWNPIQNDRLLGGLGVKHEIRYWAEVKSARSKEASVVNMKYMQIGLVIWSGSPLSLLLSYPSSW